MPDLPRTIAPYCTRTKSGTWIAAVAHPGRFEAFSSPPASYVRLLAWACPGRPDARPGSRPGSDPRAPRQGLSRRRSGAALLSLGDRRGLFRQLRFLASRDRGLLHPRGARRPGTPGDAGPRPGSTRLCAPARLHLPQTLQAHFDRKNFLVAGSTSNRRWMVFASRPADGIALANAAVEEAERCRLAREISAKDPDRYAEPSVQPPAGASLLRVLVSQDHDRFE